MAVSAQVHAQKKFVNPFDRGFALNCVDSCCRPAFMAITRKGPIWAEDGSPPFPPYPNPEA